MHDPQDLRELARKCRVMTGSELKPHVNRQLWLWAAELADYADEIERRPQAAERAGASIDEKEPAR